MVSMPTGGAGDQPPKPPLLSDRGLLVLVAAALIGLAAARSAEWMVGLTVTLAAAGLLKALLSDQ